MSKVTSVSRSGDHSQAYKEAAVELAKGIALGAVPFLGQAIDAYDTVESCVMLYNSDSESAKEDAQFDLLLAIVGWVPGAGDGLKKSLRIVNRNPQRFAPVLFDLLRFVLEECGVKTSPEALLEQMFNAGKLTAQIDSIITGVKGSSAFKSLPNWTKTTVVTVLAASRDNMPVMIGVVEKRLKKWKGMQRNSSASSSGTGRPAEKKKPANRDSAVASTGKDGASSTHSNRVEASSLGQQALASITNEGLGVSGEHIADYICAKEFRWGKDWDGHDKGVDGKWLEGTPNASKLGKLSKGGTPKAAHVLYKLTDPANGTGIDSVWRADPATNEGKKFAVVEAKASKNEDAPKFLRKPNNTRKPSVTSTLGVSGLTDASELLEPIEEPMTQATGGKQSGRAKQSGKTGGAPAQPSASKQKARPPKPILVQMSAEWIEENIEKAVSKAYTRAVLSSYSRHLFYSPLYHPSLSPKEHAEAQLKGQDGKHEKHAAFHYGESEVKKAVNKRKKSLTNKYGAQRSLRAEA
ncbi:hypothetical protein [Pseudomonas chlororaphis]|uniref:hypothetical protein n=1 Tax=Pseudomonas chlororaphis TaxID=587753 RepID=UPI000F58D336|nr:hypothetical protein [Pseudomonas chlororaphis]AZE05139.1 hypothetical protein C4K11_2977 [Pseudomonas chlororaphis subsp. aureofaciens]